MIVINILIDTRYRYTFKFDLNVGLNNSGLGCFEARNGVYGRP